MTLPTINLKGKQYVQVKDRLKYFREHFADYGIVTVPTIGKDGVVFKAEICNKDGRVVSTGHSFGSFQKDKGMEKQESVAVGRALAFFGIGIDNSVASADEMQDFNSVEK